jgi:hypothetical protein
MAKLKNKTRRDIELPSRHIIPREGVLIIPDDVAKSIDNWLRLQTLIFAGDMTAEFDPEEPVEASVETKDLGAKDLGKVKKA